MLKVNWQIKISTLKARKSLFIKTNYMHLAYLYKLIDDMLLH